MAICPEHRVRHTPYTCGQYEELRAAENAADAVPAGVRTDGVEQLLAQMRVPDGPLDCSLTPAEKGRPEDRERALLTELALCGIEMGRLDRAAVNALARDIKALLVARWLRDAHRSGALAAEAAATAGGVVSTGRWDQESAGPDPQETRDGAS